MAYASDEGSETRSHEDSEWLMLVLCDISSSSLLQEDSKNEVWESLKGNGRDESREYSIELLPLEEAIKPIGKRRR